MPFLETKETSIGSAKSKEREDLTMKRNGAEYIESGLGGHPRFDRKCGTVAVNIALDNFLEKRGMAKVDFSTIQQPKSKKTK